MKSACDHRHEDTLGDFLATVYCTTRAKQQFNALCFLI